MAEELAFVFASGTGEVGRQSVSLLRSIRHHHPDAPVYAFVPEEEADAMAEDVEEMLRSDATVLAGGIPIPEYPISAKVGAMAAAEAETDADYLLMLDTDTVLLDRVDCQEGGSGDCYLKPVDVGRQFWGRERSHDRWRALYDRHDLQFPDWRVRSTFDGRTILPYWNAGFVMARPGSFAKRWLELTADLHGEIPYDRHADQVALGLLSSDLDVGVVDERYNYPLQLHLGVPADVVVLHYHDTEELVKVRDPDVAAQLQAVGAWHEMAVPSVAYARFMAGAASTWLRRKTLPIDETHALERAYLSARSLVGADR